MNKDTKKTGFKKWFGYLSNGFLVLIILILLIPSWRVKFQAWYQNIFLDDVEFKTERTEAIPLGDRDWTLFDMEGVMFNFNEFKGQPIVLNFWATWCPSCRAELPEIAELHEELGEKIKFIAVSEENIDVILKTGLNDDYSFLFCTQEFPQFFNITSYPTLLIIDKQMNVVSRTVGAGGVSNEKNKEFLNNLLEN